MSTWAKYLHFDKYPKVKNSERATYSAKVEKAKSPECPIFGFDSLRY